ncbi:MAG: glycosyltransferase family 2 protein [Haloarculaceae archaeon]
MSDHQTQSLASSQADVVIGIPAYNEQETVAQVVNDAAKHASTVLVVDDGSDDRTATVARAAGADVVEHAENRGYGAALRTIFREANDRDADHLAVLDADGQHDPADVTDLVATQHSSGAEVVIGSRFVGGARSDAPLYRRVGLTAINRIVGLALRIGYSRSSVRDTQSGFRVYDAGTVELLAERAELSDGMDASVDILFRAAEASCEFVEVPVDVSYDVEEANTHNPLVHGSVLLRNVATRVLAERPRRTLGVPGLCFLFVGLSLFLVSLTSSAVVEAIPSVFVVSLIAGGMSLAGVALAFDRGPSRQ